MDWPLQSPDLNHMEKSLGCAEEGFLQCSKSCVINAMILAMNLSWAENKCFDISKACGKYATCVM